MMLQMETKNAIFSHSIKLYLGPNGFYYHDMFGKDIKI